MLLYTQVLIFDYRGCLPVFINGAMSHFKIDFELKVAFFVTDYQEHSQLCNSYSFFYAYSIEFASPRTRFSKVVQPTRKYLSYLCIINYTAIFCGHLHTQKKKTDPRSYRPVGLTSVPSKIVENILLRSIEKHLEYRSHLSQPAQLREGKSCLSNLISFYERVYPLRLSR